MGSAPESAHKECNMPCNSNAKVPLSYNRTLPYPPDALATASWEWLAGQFGLSLAYCPSTVRYSYGLILITIAAALCTAHYVYVSCQLVNNIRTRVFNAIRLNLDMPLFRFR